NKDGGDGVLSNLKLAYSCLLFQIRKVLMYLIWMPYGVSETADREQLAQMQILYKAQQRQIAELEQKLEDSRRNARYLEHQFAIVKDEKDGLAVSLKESSQLVEEAKEREVQMQNKVKAMEQQVQVLNERDQENTKKQRVAESAVDSMKQQMLELCRSDTLSRAREQHDRDLAIIKEQHEAVLLGLQQKLDTASQALNEQIDIGQRFREQVKQLERQREEEQLERARVINALTQRLEESQQQCAKLLQTSSVQEFSQMQIKLQQAQSAKTLSENMNKVLQEDLADLKEQITLYESAVKHGVIAFDLSNDWENQLSDSCMDLGLKKANRKNGTLHSTALAHLLDSKLPKDEALQLLRVEMQRCLASLKGKRQKISQLQEELQRCKSQVNELQVQLDETKLSYSVLEKKNKELKQSEEKLRSANSELCTKMREMIQELDQEKQEAMREENAKALEMLRAELEAQHQSSVIQLKALWSKEKEAEIQQQVNSHVASAKVTWKEELQKVRFPKITDQFPQLSNSAFMSGLFLVSVQMESTWTQRLEEARREKDQETAEAFCQTDKTEGSCMTITLEELDSRLSAQEHQLQLEADKIRCKAVEEARKQAQRELHEKHLEDMAKQVEGAVTRAYSHWIEDLTSLTEYQASLQTEKEKWEELQEKHTAERVTQALRDAEEQWNRRQKKQLEEQNSGALQLDELQEQVATLQSQLEQLRREQAALLKAELAAARATWNRDKQQEITIIQVRSEQMYQTKLEEQQKKLGQALQGAREDADLQKKELLLQMEAKLQQTVRAREEEWRCQHAEKELMQRQQIRDELLAELQTGLAEIKEQLLRDPKTDQGSTEDTTRTSGAQSEGSVTHMVQASCRDLVSRAVSQAKKEWKKVSCYWIILLLKMKQSFNYRTSSHQQNLQQGLEEMKQQYLMTVEKIRGDMLRYLQESRERAAEMIRMEVQRERQHTARKMRRYYLTCLQELLEDGGKTTGAEKKIMNAASKLAAMAKVLETPVKSKSGKNCILPSECCCPELLYCWCFILADCLTPVSTSGCPPGRNAGFSRNPSTVTEPPDIRPEERSHGEKTSADSELKSTATNRTIRLSHRDISASGKEEASVDIGIKPQSAAHTHLRSYKPSQQVASPSQVDFVSVSVRNNSRELYLQEGDSNIAHNLLDSERQGKPFLLQEAPVREEKQTNWTMGSSDLDTNFQVPRFSYSERKVEPVKPFSVSTVSAYGEFGGFTPDESDLTVYNEISKTTPHPQMLNFASAKMSTRREPTPGSEGEKQQGTCSRPVFSELRQYQQDSGFDSPFYPQK
uniref:Centrosomal protein 152 n=1 Tax=Mastacembelus armatus TaxID=205130 RepID=A0A7N8XHE8_9TELE